MEENRLKLMLKIMTKLESLKENLELLLEADLDRLERDGEVE